MTTLIFLPAHVDDPWHWLRIGEGGAVTSGEGLPDGDLGAVIGIAPADAVTLHWAVLPARSPAQASAAARILVMDAVAGPLDDLHVAVGDEGQEERPIGVVAGARMRGWLASMATLGIDPVAILPAPLLLPRPESGFVRANIGGQSVVRGTASGFADEARLTELITGDPPETLTRDALDAGVVAAVTRPVLDLRQGPFARRKRRAIDWRLVRRLAALGALILLVTLVIDLARIAKYSIAADAAEAKAEALARSGLPRGADQGDADRLLAERLSNLRGPGAGFTATTAAVADAVRGIAGTEIVALAFEPTGECRVTVAAQGEAQANQLVARLRDRGFRVTASTFEANGERLRGDVTVSVP